MDRYPEYRFVVSQAQHLAWMRDHYPDLWERMKVRIAEGRLEPTGSMWVEADCNIPSGESLVRQIVYGKRFYLDELGIETNDVWLPDVFGYSAALPQIMRRSGIRWFLTQKLSWNQYNVLPHHSFLWEGIDGSRVFTHFPPADTYSGNMSVRELRFGVENFKDHDRATRRSTSSAGATAAAGRPARCSSRPAGWPTWTACPGSPWRGRVQFFTEAEAEIRRPGRLGGRALSRAPPGHLHQPGRHQAREPAGRVRTARRRAVDLGSAPGAGLTRAAELEELWKLLLLHQFHDIIPGSGIHWVYEDTARDHARILSETGRRDRRRAGAPRRRHRHHGHAPPVVVFNSLSHTRTRARRRRGARRSVTAAVADVGTAVAVQRDAEGAAVFEATVPACGYRVYDLVTGGTRRPSRRSTAGVRSLENEHLRVELDDHGLVSSIFDKAAGRQVLAPGAKGNRFQLHPDYPNFFDAWDIDRFAFDQVVELDEVESVEVVDQGPVRAGIRVTRRSGLVDDPADRTGRRVAVHRLRHRGGVARDESTAQGRLPGRRPQARATYEIQYGHVERPTHANTSWDVARFEVCAHKWADLSEPGYGVALLNDSKYGYDILGQRDPSVVAACPDVARPVADRGQHRFTVPAAPPPRGPPRGRRHRRGL